MSNVKRIARIVCLTSLSATLFNAPAIAQGGRKPGGAEPIPSIDERTNGLKKIDGFYPLYLDEAAGRLWLEIPKLDVEVLYSTGLATGLGSNDLGLDRGILTGSRIVKFERAGPKVLMVQPNYQFRALTTNAAEARTVRDAFARSVLWGFQIGAMTGDRILVDFTEYLVRDGNDMAGRLRPGSYRFDATRSSIHPPMTLGFPKNTEMEAELTFVRQPGAAGAPGGGGGRGGGAGAGAFFEGVGSVAANAEAASIRIHHSIVELPDGNYKPRRFDPRSGFGSLEFENYAALPGQPMTERFLRRHRLQKKDPSAAVSEPVKPIIYYLDPGAPEPIRSALLDGARWWNQAFEAAGYRDALPRRAPAGRREPARHPLQRDQLGPPVDARLEHRRERDRSAHGRDHQGRRDARFAADPSGLHDRGRPPEPVQGRHRERRRN